MQRDYTKLCGWIPNPAFTAQFVAQQDVRTFSEQCQHLYRIHEAKDTFLWDSLLRIKPSWKRGEQAIGSCVAWGAELACTLLMAIQQELGISQFLEEAATEGIYGGRAEIGQGSWSDGWWGSGAAKYLTTTGGVIIRIDYSQQTGNAETDMRVYSGDKEKNWGFYGCGGKKDGLNGPFDAVAKTHAVRAATLVKTTAELEQAMLNRNPVTVASGIGYGGMVRDKDGVVRISGSWAHQMLFGGIAYHSSRGKLFRLFNSWGVCASGPDPLVKDKAVSDSSWWVVEADAQRQLNEEDSFAYAGAQGWPSMDLPNSGAHEYL